MSSLDNKKDTTQPTLYCFSPRCFVDVHRQAHQKIEFFWYTFACH